MSLGGLIVSLAVLLALLGGSVALGADRDCTQDDLVQYVTACEEGQQYIIYAIPSAAECVEGEGFVVPPPVGVECGMRCDPGTYIDTREGDLAAEAVCTPCEGDETSIGGGDVYDFTKLTSLPLGFNTLCSPDETLPEGASGCGEGWSVQDGSLECTGTGLGYTSSIYWTALFLVNGELRVDFRTLATPLLDLLEVRINGVLLDSLSSGADVGDSIEEVDWTRATYPVPPGKHRIGLSYANESVGDLPEHDVQIRRIETYGTEALPDRCGLCPAGTSPDLAPETGPEEGVVYTGSCTLCPRDTYSLTGAECVPCGDDQYAPVGSKQCLDRLVPCTSDDFTPVYGACTEGPVAYVGERHVEGFVPVFPVVCDVDAYTHPALPSVPCSLCEGTHVYDREAGECVECEAGQFGNQDTHLCEWCLPGTAAMPLVAYEALPAFPDTFTSQVSDEDDLGWYMGGEGEIVCGPIHRSGQYASLSIDVPAGSTSVAIDIDTRCPVGDPDVVAQCNVNLGVSVLLSGLQPIAVVAANAVSTVTTPVSTKNRHTLTVRVAKIGSDMQGTDGDKILDMVVSVGKVLIYGGQSVEWPGDRCTTCLPGTYSYVDATLEYMAQHAPYTVTEIGDTSVSATQTGSSLCRSCPSGYFSNATTGTETCEQCEINTVAPFLGQEGCVECPAFSSSDDGVFCESVTEFEMEDGMSFNVTGLKDLGMFGPVKDDTDMKYYVSIGHNSDAASPCNAGRRDLTEAMACQVEPLSLGPYSAVTLRPTVHSTGNMMTFTRPEGAEPGVDVTLWGGDLCAHNQPRQTLIHLLCDLTMGTGTPQAGAGPSEDGSSLVETAPCLYEFYWRSVYGCRTCTPEDYIVTVSECVAGLQTVTTQWNEDSVLQPNGHCNRFASPLPAPFTQSCSNGPDPVALYICLAIIAMCVVALVCLLRQYSLLRRDILSGEQDSALVDGNQSSERSPLRRKASIGQSPQYATGSPSLPELQPRLGSGDL
ncbi:hypothetical protein KIPB_001725 [Kipferlia bialata]|uniref:MRH domain-containing protein n=1 Tax=Kipferlia bialata TaxID=797122 RepID=A0A9K3CR68_9EUKA|nr:hypothetical protein KIPB_001725 [Kipferlia bialata]|eukprot:g1725.t1